MKIPALSENVYQSARLWYLNILAIRQTIIYDLPDWNTMTKFNATYLQAARSSLPVFITLKLKWYSDLDIITESVFDSTASTDDFLSLLLDKFNQPARICK